MTETPTPTPTLPLYSIRINDSIFMNGGAHISNITFNDIQLPIDPPYTYPILNDKIDRYGQYIAGTFTLVVTLSDVKAGQIVKITDSNGTVSCQTTTTTVPSQNFTFLSVVLSGSLTFSIIVKDAPC
jgi:hypothetical protein